MRMHTTTTRHLFASLIELRLYFTFSIARRLKPNAIQAARMKNEIQTHQLFECFKRSFGKHFAIQFSVQIRREQIDRMPSVSWTCGRLSTLQLPYPRNAQQRYYLCAMSVKNR